MFDAYKVAVKLTLVNHVSTGLAAIAAQLGPLHQQFLGAQAGASGLKRELLEIKRLGLVGGAIAGVGFGGLSLMRAPLEEAKLFQTEVMKFRALGLGDVATTEAEKFAKGMNIVGQSARDNMKLIREATSIMGDLDHAKQTVPMLARMKFGLESVMGGEHGTKFDQMFQAALKTAELRGALVNRETGEIDIKRFGQTLNMMTQAYVASGGLVKPQDYLAAIKTGGVSTKLMSDEMFFFGLGHFMQESGGSRTGTASMSMFQNWLMGRMPQRVAEDMAGAGLLKKSALHYGKTGHITRVDAQGLIQADKFVESPFKWVNEVAIPMLKKQGFEGEKLNIKLASLLGIRTASNLADQFVREEKVAENYVKRAKSAAGVDDLYKLGRTGLQGQEMELQAKWRDTLRELGTTILPMAISAAQGMINTLKAFNAFAKDHQGTVKALTWAFVGLSGAMAFGGTVMLLSAAMKGLSLATTLAIGTSGAAGIAGIAAKVANFGGVIGALANPIGIAVLALGTLAAAAYAFRPLTQKEVDGVKSEGGVKLTPEAMQRSREMGWKPPTVETGSGPKNTFLSKDRMAKADQSMAAAAKTQRPFFQDVAGWFGWKQKDKPQTIVQAAQQAGNKTSIVNNSTVVHPVPSVVQAGQQAPAQSSPSVGVAPRSSRTVQVKTQVNLDGRRIAEVVTQHQARDMARPPTGPNGFDSSMNLRALGTGFAG